MIVNDVNMSIDGRWPTTKCHRLPVVAHHTNVQLIAGGPLATLFACGGLPVVHQWPCISGKSHPLIAACVPVASLPLIATGGPLEFELSSYNQYLFITADKKNIKMCDVLKSFKNIISPVNTIAHTDPTWF